MAASISLFSVVKSVIASAYCDSLDYHRYHMNRLMVGLKAKPVDNHWAPVEIIAFLCLFFYLVELPCWVRVRVPLILSYISDGQKASISAAKIHPGF